MARTVLGTRLRVEPEERVVVHICVGLVFRIGHVEGVCDRDLSAVWDVDSSRLVCSVEDALDGKKKLGTLGSLDLRALCVYKFDVHTASCEHSNLVRERKHEI